MCHRYGLQPGAIVLVSALGHPPSLPTAQPFVPQAPAQMQQAAAEELSAPSQVPPSATAAAANPARPDALAIPGKQGAEQESALRIALRAPFLQPQISAASGDDSVKEDSQTLLRAPKAANVLPADHSAVKRPPSSGLDLEHPPQRIKLEGA